MSDIGFLLIFAAIALLAAWLVNAVVSSLSGEHPRDTPSVWLDMMLGELRGFSEGLSFVRIRWVRWTVAVLIGGVVFAFLHFVFHA